MLCEKYNIKPIFAIIPDNQDESLISKYTRDDMAWHRIKEWIDQGWTPALHGCHHVYTTNDGGINPIHRRSEFAGESLEMQCEKIKKGLSSLRSHGIEPKLFIAPSHTFDQNTLEALRLETDIRVISDTIANDAYMLDEFLFLPQQSGAVRDLKLKLVTFCYHPNIMSEKDFGVLEAFLMKHKTEFVSFDEVISRNNIRGKSIVDRSLSAMYFLMRKLRHKR